MADRLSTADLTGRATATPDAPDTADADGAAATTASPEAGDRLLQGDRAAMFEGRWREIQVGFVDEPRGAVEDADNLVAELMRDLAETFSQERSRLETAWSAGESVDTEDLRVALTRYRSFFHRLLAT